MVKNITPFDVVGTDKAKGQKAGSASPAFPKETTFGEVFRQMLASEGSINVSKHAVKRIDDRGLNLSQADAQRFIRAVDKLREKGSREALVVLGEKAFVVSVKNGTVVTALSGSDIDGRVFTNIDSAIVLKN
jgi:flagellar operon protein